jgi:hypothetical protein
VRPITVTLPERTLTLLSGIDTDRARAIVKATDAALSVDGQRGKLPELVDVAPGVSVILTGASHCLQQIGWLRLIEIAPAQFLLVLPTGTPIDSLELAVIDLLENSPPEDPWEQAVLQRLRVLIGTLRRSCEISKAELLLIQKRSA